MNDSILITVFIISFIVMLVLKKIMRVRHGIRSVILSMLCGVTVLIIVNIFSGFTGVSMPVSRLSVTASAVFGIPGVTAMLLLQTLL